MKLNRNQIQELIKAIELFQITLPWIKDKYRKECEISKYTVRIFKIINDMNQTVSIINTCILGDGDRILWKLRSNLN